MPLEPKIRRVKGRLACNITCDLAALMLFAVPSQKSLNHVADDELKPFLKLFHKALPREIRDIVYEYIIHNLDASEVQSITSIMNPSRTVEGNYVVKCNSKLPRALTVNLCGRALVEEMIHAAYRASDKIYVPFSTELSRYLHFDAFGHGITPGDCTLSSLRVGVDILWYRSPIRRNTLTKEFTYLLRREQKLVRGFHLVLELKYLSFIAPWVEAEVLVFVLGTLKSIMERLRERCQAKVEIFFQSLEVTEEQLDWDTDAWVVFLKDKLNGS